MLQIDFQMLYDKVEQSEKGWEVLSETASMLGVALDDLKQEVLKKLGLDERTLERARLEERRDKILAAASSRTMNVMGVEMNLIEASDWLVTAAVTRRKVSEVIAEFVATMRSEHNLESLRWTHGPEGHGLELAVPEDVTTRGASNYEPRVFVDGKQTTFSELCERFGVNLDAGTYKRSPARELVSSKRGLPKGHDLWGRMRIEYVGELTETAERMYAAYSKRGVAVTKVSTFSEEPTPEETTSSEEPTPEETTSSEEPTPEETTTSEEVAN